MNIKTKIQYGIASSVVVIIGISFFVGMMAQETKIRIEKSIITNKIVQLTSMRRGLIFDYILHHEERPKVQWKSLLDAQTKLTSSEIFKLPLEKKYLKQINETSEDIKSVFVELVANYESPKSNPTDSMLSKEREEQLLAQLLQKIQLNTNRTYYLSETILSTSHDAQIKTILTISIGTIILLLFVILLFFLFDRFVSKPLDKLKESAVRIAALDFSNAAVSITAVTGSKDELGELAQTFNQMGVKLKKSYTELEQMVSARTKKLEEAKAKNEAILLSIGDAVMACEVSGKIVLFNHVAAELSGFSIKEAVGKHYNQVLSFIKEGTDEPHKDFIDQAIKEGKMTEMTNHAMIIRKDGTRTSVADSASPVLNKSGKIIGCVVVFRDVSKEREIDRAKSEFVSLASHQLRTPPTAIKWLIEILLNDKEGKFTEGQRNNLNDIGAENERMIKTINSFLNVSRIEMGKFSVTISSADINLCAQDVIKELKFQITAKKLRLKEKYTEQKFVISTDPNLLKMVIQNVLTNAINYSHEKGEISLEVSLKNKGEILGGRTIKKNSAVLIVSDKGCGIPKEQQNKIFTKLFRANNAGKIYNDGNGLGLYISKFIIGKFDGDIWFESEENKGTTFYVTIPLVRGSREGR